MAHPPLADGSRRPHFKTAEHDVVHMTQVMKLMSWFGGRAGVVKVIDPVLKKLL